jgi:hypothetical protein
MDVKRQIRQTLLDIARRRQRPGMGSTSRFLSVRTHYMYFPDLTSVLYPIPWAVVGAVATRMYMPERMTQDLDIVVRLADAPTVRQKLTTAGFQYSGELAIAGASWMTPDGRSIDVLESAEPWLAQALAEAQQNRDAQGLPVFPLPYLVLMKFQAGRVQDVADITRMLGQAREETLAAVRRLFTALLPEEMADLESLIALGQLEMQPPQSEKGGSAG